MPGYGKLECLKFWSKHICLDVHEPLALQRRHFFWSKPSLDPMLEHLLHATNTNVVN
jgi:hypothetical protein